MIPLVSRGEINAPPGMAHLLTEVIASGEIRPGNFIGTDADGNPRVLWNEAGHAWRASPEQPASASVDEVAMAHEIPTEYLRVLVPADLIFDGQVEFPQVGNCVEYALTFVELEPGALPEMRNELTARVEVLGDGRLSQEGVDPAGRTHPGTYSLLLHGRGWGASLYSTTLYRGTVQLTGSLSALVPEQARVRGTVTGRRLVSHTSWPDANGHYSGGGIHTFGPVREGQNGFATGTVPESPIPEGSSGWISPVPPPEGPWIQEVGVLVELRITIDEVASDVLRQP